MTKQEIREAALKAAAMCFAGRFNNTRTLIEAAQALEGYIKGNDKQQGGEV